MRKLTILVNNPYEQNNLSTKLFHHTVDNAKQMYPDSEVVAFPDTDYKQRQVWKTYPRQQG